ncbi:MerR family transcriptional regulator [Clostridium sp. YIM B02505]|uniref:MerR family transcriptional regulator n=1 Tax=Clostridium yunnanense TaxID=2800325 RepID=A0ABS1ERT6_9CLOT|nr:MerR family transcriptional regulator [Clostridium yunnanense]
MQDKNWKVGELSKLTGLTIRTLHHYDEIGLLSPSFRNDAGHRLYSEGDIIKLQQIMSLKQLDFSLDEIKQFLENPKYNPIDVIEMQLKRLEEEIRLKDQLRSELSELLDVFKSWQRPSLVQFINSIELIRNQKKYFTKEQQLKLKKQYDILNQNNGSETFESWSNIISSFQAEMDNGTPVDDVKVIKLAKQWQEGINFFTGGDSEIIHSAELYYMDNPQAAKGNGMSSELYEYIKKALANIEG